MDHNNKMKPMAKERTPKPSHEYQSLQMDQCSRDSAYQNRAKPTQTDSEYELVDVPVTNVHTQQLPTVYQSLEKGHGQKDEISNVYQSLARGQGQKGEISTDKKEGDDHRLEATMKKMKIVLAVTMTVNIVMLLLIITAAILGGVLIQSKFEQVMSAQDLSTSKLNATNSNIRELAASTYHNTTLISTQLSATNDSVTAQFDAAYSNITAVQTQFINLQIQVVSLQKQVGDIQLYCGPGEWRQVAYLNMSDPSRQCPSTWREYNTSGVRACGRPVTSGASCPGVSYSNNEQYSRVCGRAIGYQIGSPTAFYAAARTINSYYVCGVSFTHGSQRTHIWTLAAGVIENSGVYIGNCPCTTPSGPAAPSFVGDNFYCESGNPTNTPENNNLYSGDPLWDGEQCEDQCCSNGKSPPWFSVELPNPTRDDIEVRICSIYGTHNDVGINLLEIYVQ